MAYRLSFEVDSDNADPSNLLDTLHQVVEERFYGVDEQTIKVEEIATDGQMEFNERELYLLLHAVDEAARRAGWQPGERQTELWALRDKLSEAGASYVYPRKQ